MVHGPHGTHNGEYVDLAACRPHHASGGQGGEPVEDTYSCICLKVHALTLGMLCFAMCNNGYYTVFVSMPRIFALYPVAYTTDIDRREISVVYATGYNVDIRGIRHKYYIRGIGARGYPQISVVYDPRILARNLAHSPGTPLHRRNMQNTQCNHLSFAELQASSL